MAIIGLKVTAILLNGWILPIDGVALRGACAEPPKQACFLFDIFLCSPNNAQE